MLKFRLLKYLRIVVSLLVLAGFLAGFSSLAVWCGEAAKGEFLPSFLRALTRFSVVSLVLFAVVAASALLARFVAEGRMHARPFGPDACFLTLMPDYLRDVTLDGLALVAARAMARRDVFLLESEHIAAKPIPVEAHVRAIHQRIMNKKHLMFSELVDRSTPTAVVVVTFLAVLELYKRNMVQVAQEQLFGDIDIRYIEGSGELLLDGDDALTSVGEQ